MPAGGKHGVRVSLAVSPIGEAPLSAQAAAGAKRVMSAAPGNRRTVAKADTVEQPEPR